MDNTVDSKIRKERFLYRAKETHGDKYDYSIAEYIGAHVKISIICKQHGIFQQTPNSHIMGCHCPKCALISSSNKQSCSTEDFIQHAIEIHGNKYDYSDVNYINAQTKVSINCNLHGKFLQRPNHHLRKIGCPKCGAKNYKRNLKFSFEDFLKRAIKIHGENIYDYSKVNYVNNSTKICITCKIHGDFEQIPKNHLLGNGCKKCSLSKPTSWKINNWETVAKNSKKNKSFKFYIILCWNENETFFKVGRTFQEIEERFGGKREMPYNWEIIREIEGKAEFIYKLETWIKLKNENFKYIPQINFPGFGECFSVIEVGPENFTET